MPAKPTPPTKTPGLHGRAGNLRGKAGTKPKHEPTMIELYHLAEARLREKQGNRRNGDAAMDLVTDTKQLLHELQVHQIELEMQNAELRQTRNQLEVALGNYTDLYDFAPMSYFTLTADGTIRLANLTGTILVGIERDRLVGRRFGLAGLHRGDLKQGGRPLHRARCR